MILRGRLRLRTARRAGLDGPSLSSPQCFLTYSDEKGGQISLCWSTKPIGGALAVFVPEQALSAAKLKQNGGRSAM